MAKKKTTTTTKGKKERSATKPAGLAARKDAPVATAATTDAPVPNRAAAPTPERDPRLPPPGTVIEKRARDGSVRCECMVDAGGIRYKGTLFKSLSAAAMAAAKDLGIGGATQNGFTFWGLSKRPRPAADPIESLGRAWERYRARASAIVGAVKDDDRDRVHSALGEHLDALKDLRGRVA